MIWRDLFVMKGKFLLFCAILFIFSNGQPAYSFIDIATMAEIGKMAVDIYQLYQGWKDGEKVSDETKRRRAQSMTALMEAAYNDSVQEIQRLLDTGEQINAKDYDADTALTYAIAGNTPEVVKFLIDKGAYINKKNFHYAMKRNDPEILRVILNNKQFSKETLNQALISTKNTGLKLGVIIALADAGADINYPDSSKNNETILMSALKFEDQNPDFIKALANYPGAETYISDKDGKNTLMYAAQYCKNKNVMKNLLDATKQEKFIINYADNNGTTALMYAAAYNTAEIVEELLNAGADIDIKDNSGNKAVDYALGWFGGNSSVKNSPVFERLGKSDKWIRPYW